MRGRRPGSRLWGANGAAALRLMADAGGHNFNPQVLGLPAFSLQLDWGSVWFTNESGTTEGIGKPRIVKASALHCLLRSAEDN